MANDLEIGTTNSRFNNYPSGYKNSSSSSSTSSSYYVESLEYQWISWLIPLFIVANVAVFIVVMYVNNCPKYNMDFDGDCAARLLDRLSFQPLNDNPLFGPSASTLEKMGALERTKIVHAHQVWRLITSIWLHAGVIHLFANMLSLVFIGIRLEQQFGFVRVGTIYMLSGFGGSILSSLFLRQNISVGASGAMFGLLGAILSEFLTNWTVYTNKAAALFTLLVIIAVNLAVGILPHVDNFAHIGGFLTGFLLGFVLLLCPQIGRANNHNVPVDARVKSKHKAHQYVLCLVAMVLVTVGISVGLVMLFEGKNGNDHCSWCHYISCVPTSNWKCSN